MIVTKEISVTGMHCCGCETIIEEAVNLINGILFVKAEYLKASLKVSFDTTKTNMTQILEACTAKGYTFGPAPDSKKQKISNRLNPDCIGFDDAQ